MSGILADHGFLLRANGALWLAWGAYWLISAHATERTRESEGWWMRLTHLVPSAIAFVLIFGWDETHVLSASRFHRTPQLSLFGDLVTAASLGFACWARAHLGRYWSGIITLKEGHRLIRTGPYAWVRHPIYTGFVGGSLGSALAAATWEALAGFTLILAIYEIKRRREETVLVGAFGDEYKAFQRETPALFPFRRFRRPR